MGGGERRWGLAGVRLSLPCSLGLVDGPSLPWGGWIRAYHAFCARISGYLGGPGPPGGLNGVSDRGWRGQLFPLEEGVKKRWISWLSLPLKGHGEGLPPGVPVCGRSLGVCMGLDLRRLGWGRGGCEGPLGWVVGGVGSVVGLGAWQGDAELAWKGGFFRRIAGWRRTAGRVATGGRVSVGPSCSHWAAGQFIAVGGLVGVGVPVAWVWVVCKGLVLAGDLRDVAVYYHFAISTFPVEIVIKSSAFILEYLLQLPIKSGVETRKPGGAWEGVGGEGAGRIWHTVDKKSQHLGSYELVVMWVSSCRKVDGVDTVCTETVGEVREFTGRSYLVWGVGSGLKVIPERTMSSPNHSTSDIEDTFSSMNILNYTSVSSDYFPASSGSISFNSSKNSNIIPSVISPFYNNPCLKDVQAFYAKESPISPPDSITPPAILTPSPVLPPSLLFDP
ncbi:hypothetical protein Tco_0685985 [Tanacetum coccineum]